MTAMQHEVKKNGSIFTMSDEEKADSANLNFDNEEDFSDDEDESLIHIRTGEVAHRFWTWEEDKKTHEFILSGLYRDGIISELENKQFGKRYRPDKTATFFIQGDSIIKTVIDTVMRDSLKEGIYSDTDPVQYKYIRATAEGLREIFNRQQHLIVNPRGLEMLNTHTKPLLRDNATTCYIPYRNGIVEITKTGARILPYEFLANRCIWETQVINRDFKLNVKSDDCHIARFFLNISNKESDRLRAARGGAGYLMHHFGNPSEGQAIILYDEEITDARKPEGGTGKGVYCNAIRQIRPVAVLDGKKFDPNDRFCFQQVDEDTVVVWIDDPVVNHPKAERRFSLERFFSLSTEGWSIEKKHQHAFRIPAKEGPKLLISSNVVMPNEGSSNIRRQFIIEFSNHYKSKIRKGNEKPIQAEHGCIFFSDDWDEEEWQKFDHYMIGCVVEYLRDGLQPYELRSADQNRLRQIAGEEFYEWITTYQGTGLVLDREYSRDELFGDYKRFAGIPENQAITRGFTNNITQYAKGKGWKYERGPSSRNATFFLKPQETCK